MKLGFDGDTRKIFYTTQDEVYIGTVDGKILVSKDKGFNWDSIPNPLDDLEYSNLNFVDKSGNYLITVGASGTFYLSHKDSLIWRQMNNSPDGCLDIKENNSCLFSLDWGSVTKSNEDWTEWTEVLDKNNTAQFNAIAVDSIGTVYAGSIDRMIGRESGIYRSYDDGNTWEWYPEIYGIMDMAVDSEGRIFAADFYQVLRSTDNGDSWQSMQNLNAYPYCIHVNAADEIYIGASADWAFAGVAYSQDHGVTWDVINEGFITSGEFYTGHIYDITESPDGYLYLATYGGVYRSVHSTTGIEDTAQLVSKPELYQNYPNPFNNETNISFSINENSDVGLSIFNIKGEFIKNICEERLEKGFHNYSFKADELKSGVYFYKLMINGKLAETKKMIYLR